MDTLATMHASVLALEFGRQLRAELTHQQMVKVITRNRAEPANSGVCHSHDFCDANMVMLAAFEAVMKREPATLSGVGDDDADAALWNAAWSEAIKNEFN